jgi:Tat protein translocase TatB subunit
LPTSLGPAEILVILVVALIVLGPSRLPEAGRQVGKALAEVRKWSQGFQEELRSTIDPDATRPSYSQPQPGYTPPPPATAAEQAPPATAAEQAPPATAAEQAPPPAGAADAATPPATAAEQAPPAMTNGAGATTGSHGLISEPLPTDWTPADPSPADPAGPPADDPPRG